MSGVALYYAVKLEGSHTPQERALLAALAYFVGRNSNQCTPGMAKLQAKSGLSKHHLTKTLKSLQDKGLVKVGQRKDTKERWRNTSNAYTLTFMPTARAGSVEHEGVDIWRI